MEIHARRIEIAGRRKVRVAHQYAGSLLSYLVGEACEVTLHRASAMPPNHVGCDLVSHQDRIDGRMPADAPGGLPHAEPRILAEARIVQEADLLRPGHADHQTEATLGGRVEDMIADSVRALVERDSELAARTIEADHQINRAEIETDQRCLEILAKRQPMASDLRFITLTLKMVTDLERIADLAVNICERAIFLNKQPSLGPYIDIPRMAVIVQGMLHDAIQAFIEKDTELAHQVIGRDDEVDDLYHKVFRSILVLMNEDGDILDRGISIQGVAKILERMADHTTNLAEQVVFMVQGQDIRHLGKLDD